MKYLFIFFLKYSKQIVGMSFFAIIIFLSCCQKKELFSFDSELNNFVVKNNPFFSGVSQEEMLVNLNSVTLQETPRGP